MKHIQGASPFRRESRRTSRTRRSSEWARPFSLDDPLWREWCEKKQQQRKEIF